MKSSNFLKLSLLALLFNFTYEGFSQGIKYTRKDSAGINIYTDTISFIIHNDMARYFSGSFWAGIEIPVEALAARAAQLRRVELVKPKNVIGKNTVEALQSGTIYGFAGQVDGLVDRICDELVKLYPDKPDVTVIATGGLAPLVIGVSENIDFHEPDLTLIGLRLVHERNS